MGPTSFVGPGSDKLCGTWVPQPLWEEYTLQNHAFQMAPHSRSLSASADKYGGDGGSKNKDNVSMNIGINEYFMSTT